MQWPLKSKGSDEEQIEETIHTYLPYCPFCGTEYPMSYEEKSNEKNLFCRNCGRKWSIRYNLGTIWFLRTSDSQQKKRYTGSWIVKRAERSLEGIRPYLLLETNYFKMGKQKGAEQGIDRFVWKVEQFLEYFDRYDRLIKGHSCERIKVAFACARMVAGKEKDTISGSGLSVKQVAAVTNLPELEASNCTQRLLNEGSISFEVRPEKGLTGTEAVIVGFLGEPRYQMNENTAEKMINELFR